MCNKTCLVLQTSSRRFLQTHYTLSFYRTAYIEITCIMYMDVFSLLFMEVYPWIWISIVNGRYCSSRKKPCPLWHQELYPRPRVHKKAHQQFGCKAVKFVGTNYNIYWSVGAVAEVCCQYCVTYL